MQILGLMMGIETFFDDIFEGKIRKDLIKDKLEEMHQRGETVEEIVSAAKAMIKRMNQISPNVGGGLLDIVGTGGDGKGTLNISTISAFVAAGAGCNVAKHCNRGISSKFGSVDLLEELGINVNLPPEKTKELIEKIGIGFMYAPLYHPAMKNVAEIRKEIGHRTIFNLLGPLTNPANAQTRLIGAYNLEAAKKIAYSAKKLDIQRFIVVHAHVEGWDEISATNPTTTFYGNMLSEGIQEKCYIPPFSMKGDLRVSSARESADICKKIFYNERLSEREEAMKASVLLNAGMAIYAHLWRPTKEDCLRMAKKSLESGNAARKLELLIEESKI